MCLGCGSCADENSGSRHHASVVRFRANSINYKCESLTFRFLCLTVEHDADSGSSNFDYFDSFHFNIMGLLSLGKKLFVKGGLISECFGFVPSSKKSLS